MSLEDFAAELRSYINEENDASRTYQSMSERASSMGLGYAEVMLHQMSMEEQNHAYSLEKMAQRAEAKAHGSGYYWEITNMSTGEISSSDTVHLTMSSAMAEAEEFVEADIPWWRSDQLIIKIYDKNPDERAGRTFEPVSTKTYGAELGYKTRTHEPVGTAFPNSYEEWRMLAERIKSHVSHDFELHTDVNFKLAIIEEGVSGVDDAKRWLTSKAGELGIQ